MPLSSSDRFDLNRYETGDGNWTHTDTVDLLDETAIQTDVAANRPASGTYDDELYYATDDQVLYGWNETDTEWKDFAYGKQSTPTWAGKHSFEADLATERITSLGNGEGLSFRTTNSSGTQVTRFEISDGIDGSYFTFPTNERFRIEAVTDAQFYMVPSGAGGEGRFIIQDSNDDGNWWIRTDDSGRIAFDNQNTPNEPFAINNDDTIDVSSGLYINEGSMGNPVYATIGDIPASEQEEGNQVYVQDDGDGDPTLVVWKE